MVNWVKLVVLVISTLISLFCIFLLINGKKTEGLLKSLDPKEFPLKETYSMGLKWCDLIKYQYVSKEDKRFRKEINLLYGEKYVEYYLRIVHARRFSLTLLCMAVFSNFSCLAKGDDVMMTFFAGCLISGSVYYYYSTSNRELIKQRTQQYMGDFPDILSKLALLVNAGMMLREAWEKVAFSKTSPLYRQMQVTTEEIRNGKTEMQAYYAFGLRTASGDIRKFSSMIIQGLEKGNRELAYTLADLSSEMWGKRKQEVIKQGALASGKLMVPMVIMFVGIMVMVLVPIFSNLGI